MFSLVALALFGADVHALGSDSFEARQRASARLEAHAWLSWRACDFRFADLERRRRASWVMRKAMPFRGPMPLIVAPIPVRVDEGDVLLILPWRRLWEDMPWYPADPFREATRALAEASVRVGLPPAVALAVITQLAEEEKRIPRG